jgi:hypothetical protein
MLPRSCADTVIVAACEFCGKDIPPLAMDCPHCHRLKPSAASTSRPASTAASASAAVATVEQPTTSGGEEVYELLTDAAEIPEEWQHGAIYTLEFPVRCPHCREAIRTVRVFRLKRTVAAFTSPLPRGGRVVVCPECETIFSAELTAI